MTNLEVPRVDVHSASWWEEKHPAAASWIRDDKEKFYVNTRGENGDYQGSFDTYDEALEKARQFNLPIYMDGKEAK